MIRKLLALAVATLCIIPAKAGLPPGGQQSTSARDAGWWNAAWQNRLRVGASVTGTAPANEHDWAAFNRFEASPLTASAEIFRKDPEALASQQDVRVIDSRGNVVPCKAYFVGKPETLTVLFPVPRTGGDYDIYYGSDKAEGLPPGDWLPATNSLTITTLAITAQRLPKSLPQIKAALRGNTTLHGRMFVNQIEFSSNPIRLYPANQLFVTCIEGLLNCEAAGEYQFSLDSGGPAFLLVDGKPAGSSDGTHRPSGQWRSATTIMLSEGYHHLRLVTSEYASGGRFDGVQGVRLGWLPPGAEHIDVVPRSAYAKYVQVVPREFRQANKPYSTYFTCNNPSVGVNIQGKTVVPVELVNLSSTDGSGTWEYVWEINKVTEIRDRQPKVPLEIDQVHIIKLKAYKDARLVDSLERAYRPTAHTTTKPIFRLEPIGAPNIVFIGERENLSFRVHSNIPGSVALDWFCTLRKPAGTKDGKPIYKILDETNGTLSGASFGESALSIPLDTTRFDVDAEVVVTLSITGVPVTTTLFHVIPVGSRIEHLKNAVDCLINGDGNRAIISTFLVDQSSFRKWAVPLYLKRTLDFQKKKVLLYGSPMENTPCAGETFNSYVSRLRDRCQGACAGFEFVKRVDEVNGILADVPRFAQVLASKDAELIIISPGSSDVRRGIPIRDFKRSLHLMLDLIRMKNPEIRAVLVSPPPLATNVLLSNQYRTATKEVAEENRVAFVDIHTPLDGRSLWRYFKSKLDDGVYLTYPNDEGQEDIANAIYGALK